MSETLTIKREAIVMANARRLIKKSKRTINWLLYMELFGAGSNTAIERCENLGLDPYSNSTSYRSMIEYINKSHDTNNN